MMVCVRLKVLGIRLVNNICIGTAQFGMQYGIANHSGKPAFDEVLRIVELATKNSTLYYDTAQSYGDGEQILGKAFTKLAITDEVRCISKLKPGQEKDIQLIVDSVKSSLQKLKVPSLWAIMAHRVEQANSKEIRTAIEILKAKGKIKYWGVSIYQPEDALLMLKNDSIDIIQVPFNILDRRLLDNNFFPLARNHNKMVFIRSLFLQGLIFLTPTQLLYKGMSWAIPYLDDVNQRIMNLGVPKEVLAIQAVKNIVPDAVIILGVEKVIQLRENLDILLNRKIYIDQVSSWWDGLLVYPEKLINPTLW